MLASAKYPRHCEAEKLIPAPATELFAYLDRHSQLSAHMGKRSWMMGGGRMDMTADEGGFKRLGSRLRLGGKAFGITIFLEEAVTVYEPPLRRNWDGLGRTPTWRKSPARARSQSTMSFSR